MKSYDIFHMLRYVPPVEIGSIHIRPAWLRVVPAGSAKHALQTAKLLYPNLQHNLAVKEHEQDSRRR